MARRMGPVKLLLLLCLVTSAAPVGDGWEALEAGDGSRARTSFTEALAVAERDGDVSAAAKALLGLSQVDELGGDLQGAIEKLRRGRELALRPDERVGFDERIAQLLLVSDRSDEAIAELEAAIGAVGASGGIWAIDLQKQLGDLHLQLGNASEARAWYERARNGLEEQSAPEDLLPPVLHGLATAHLALREPGNAAKVCDRWIEISIGTSWLRESASVCKSAYRLAGRPQEANWMDELLLPPDASRQ